MSEPPLLPKRAALLPLLLPWAALWRGFTIGGMGRIVNESSRRYNAS
ncbi:MAG TPA: hypothetical protein VH540_16350 [Ktedonobacterales bacterium]|jgi:hypothetical protein